jgi:hypothetical protein
MSRLQKSEQRLGERCAVIASMVLALKPIYDSVETTETQKALLETVVGAAIWYLYQPRTLWTGRISEAAHAALPLGNPTRDHEYPRKMAGRELFRMTEKSISAEAILNLYLTKFGRFNLVTSDENKRLVKYQKGDQFVTAEMCYESAGIRLMEAAEDPVVKDALAKTRRSRGTTPERVKN